MFQANTPANSVTSSPITVSPEQRRTHAQNTPQSVFRDRITHPRLERLAALKAQGILTDQEFEDEKVRVLGPSRTLIKSVFQANTPANSVTSEEAVPEENQGKHETRRLGFIGCLGSLVLVSVVGAMCGLLLSGGEDGDLGTKWACIHFRELMSDLEAGIVTDSEIHEKMKTVQNRASASENIDVRFSATNLLRAAIIGDPEGFLRSTQSMHHVCEAAGR